MKLTIVGTGALFLGMILLLFSRMEIDPSDIAREVEANLNGQLKLVQNQLSELELSTIPTAQSLFAHQNSFDYPVYIFRAGKLVYWSDNKLELRLDQRLHEQSPDQIPAFMYHQQDGWKGVIVSGYQDRDNIRVFGFVDLKYEPPFQNKYLQQEWNERIFGSGDFTIFNGLESVGDKTKEGEGGTSTIDIAGLFKITPGPTYHQGGDYALLSIYPIGLGWILLGIALFLHVRRSLSQGILGSFAKVLLFYLVTFGLAKFITATGIWREVSIFDPRVYASSWYLSHLFNLMLFCLLMLGLALLLTATSTRFGFRRMLTRMPPLIKITSIFPLVVILLYVMTFQFLVLRDIYDNSQISLDINHNISFTTDRIAAFAIVIINSYSFFLLFNFLWRVWLISVRGNRLIAVIPTVVALAFYILAQNKFPFTFLIPLAIGYSGVLFVTGLHSNFRRLSYMTLLYFSLGMVVSGLIVSFSINQFETKRSVERIEDYADRQLVENDVFGEFLMSEAISKIEEDPFIANWLSSPFISKEIISRKISSEYLERYFDRYEVQIFLFNQSGRPISGAGSVEDFSTIAGRYATRANETNFDGVYQIGQQRADLLKRYLAMATIKRFDINVGYVVIDFDQRTVRPGNVYPELLVDSRLLNPPSSIDISYAIFASGAMLNSVGDYNYAVDFPRKFLEDPDLYQTGLHHKGKLHFGKQITAQRRLVVSTQGHQAQEFLSVFSFVYLLLIVCTGLLFFLVYTPLRPWKRAGGFAAKIQLYLNLAFILPLFLVSISLLSLLNRRSIVEIKEDYLQIGNQIADVIQEDLDAYSLQASLENRENVSDRLREASDFLNVDADLYGLDFRVLATTQRKIYNEPLLAPTMKPDAIRAMFINQSNQFVTDSRVGQLDYNITYVPVRTLDTRQIIGVLALPFFDFQTILETQQIGVITNIVNIFSIVFILLLVISYLVSRGLVSPLKMIASKLTKTSFTGYNEPIEWDSKDEIGMLVSEYNNMIGNLEDSRERLARNQKELAWREIAQQVAHEIKNPLTPMKLTLQQLQRRLSSGKSLNQDEISKPLESILHQVDTLKDIATSFSAFAKMPIPDKKRFDLVKLMSTTIGLHKNDLNAEVEFISDQKLMEVEGDENLMGRIVSNILINAVQSSGGRRVKIRVDLKRSDSKASLAISDNGPGIPQEYRDKVFLPMFSTKENGSGIGLAIAKHGIEHSGGQIWFTTDTGEDHGTTFYIELPLPESNKAI